MINSGKSESYAKSNENALRARNYCNSTGAGIKLSPFLLDTCPCNFLHPSFNSLMVMADQFDKGNLYESGGLANQSNQVIDYINHIAYLKQLYKTKQEATQNKGK